MNKFKFPADVIGELHPLFKGLQWVCAARSTDDDRPVLNLISIERDGLTVNIVATDGKRLHLHTFDPGMFDDDIQMIEPGLYDVIAKSSKLIVIAEPEDSFNYPNWRGIVPSHKTTDRDIVTASSIGKIGIRTGVLLATDFTLDAIGFKHGRGKDESVAISYGHGGNKAGAFLIEHDLGTAVVMPLKMEDAEKGEVEATPFMKGLAKQEPKHEAQGDEPTFDAIEDADDDLMIHDSAEDEEDAAADNDFGEKRRADALKCIQAIRKEKKKANRELLLDKMIEDYGDAGAIELARLATTLSDIPKDVREMILERAREADPSGQHGDY